MASGMCPSAQWDAQHRGLVTPLAAAPHQPSSRVGSAHPRSPSRRDPGHGHAVLVAPGPPGQHPREAGAPLRCCHSYQRALGLGLLPCSPCRCCLSWGITGLGRSEAGECMCRHLGLLCIFPTTGFKQITGLFFFFYCHCKPLFLFIS